MNEQMKATITTWAAAITAGGVFFSGIQVYLLKVQIDQDNDRSKRLTAVQSVREWNQSQPPNAAQCIKFMANMEQPPLEAVINREQLTLTGRNIIQAQKCLSDLDNNGFFEGDVLTKKGSSKVVERVMMAVNADESVILGYSHGIGDKNIIFEQLHNAVDICEKNYIEKLKKVRGHSNAYPAIEKFLREHPLDEQECK